jgi:hypothetical protein
MYDWDFNCFIAAKVFKQTSCVPWGSAKSPAAKLMWFFFAIIAVTMAISSSLIGFSLYALFRKRHV